MKVAIIYWDFLDPRGRGMQIGGVQTYLLRLADLIRELGGDPILFQRAEIPFERQKGALKVVGIVPARSLWVYPRKDLFKAAVSHIDYGKDILIFGADFASVRAWNKKCISIQHGISWDAPARFFGKAGSKYLPIPRTWWKKWAVRRAKGYFENCPNRVCVDHNFLNWYRTRIGCEPRGNVWVIPNFVDIAPDFEATLPRPWNETVRIIFARRLVELRGTRLMESASEQLLSRHAHLRITFAGEGTDLERLIGRFAGDSRVTFTKYTPDQSILMHSTHDIAVVPSLASEGTSLSVAEAMAAGCAVVATNIGGITNMIIDGYNGLLVPPEAGALTEAIDKLIVDSERRIGLGLRAQETAGEAFSLAKWKKAWTHVLNVVERG